MICNSGWEFIFLQWYPHISAARGSWSLGGEGGGWANRILYLVMEGVFRLSALFCASLDGRYGKKRRALGPFRVVLGWACRGLNGGFLLLQNFSVAISVSPHVCFILVLILISMFLR